MNTRESRVDKEGMSVKIFIDSARLEEIEKAKHYGLLDGVTTNPSLIKAAVEDLKKKGESIDIAGYIRKILTTAEGKPVSLEITETSHREMVAQGKKLFALFNPVANNVYIKVPINPSFGNQEDRDYQGIQTIRDLSEQGIPVNCTLIFTPEQALLAAKAGAKFVSPFAGRIDDDIRARADIPFGKADYFPAEGLYQGDVLLDDNGIVSGIDLVRQIVEIFQNFAVETEVLAASIRNARQAREAALAGADIATLPFSVIRELLVHHKTAEGMEKFTQDIVPAYADLMK